MADRPDERHLEGFDPYDALDAEAARVEALLRAMAADDLDDVWDRPSRCEGWSARDVVAHLAATEEYHHACLDGQVQQFIADGLAAGYASVDDFNQGGIDARRDTPVADLVEEWAVADAETRRRLRERDGGEIDSTIGPYPLRWQAFHVAMELATHADDIALPLTPDEAADRLAWRAAFSRFALTEKHPDATVEALDDGTHVVVGDLDAIVDDETLVAGVVGRLGDDADPALREGLAAH